MDVMIIVIITMNTLNYDCMYVGITNFVLKSQLFQDKLGLLQIDDLLAIDFDFGLEEGNRAM